MIDENWHVERTDGGRIDGHGGPRMCFQKNINECKQNEGDSFGMPKANLRWTELTWTGECTLKDCRVVQIL